MEGHDVRHQCLGDAVVAQPALCAVPPAQRAAVDSASTGVRIPGADLVQSTGRQADHRARCADAGRGVDPQLPIAPEPPAVGVIAGGDCAGVGTTGGDADEVPGEALVDLHRTQGVRRRAVTELSVVVVPPAEGVLLGIHRARVPPAQVDVGQYRPAEHPTGVHRPGRRRRGGVTGSELPAPAVGQSFGVQHTCAEPAHRDVGQGPARQDAVGVDPDRGGRVRHGAVAQGVADPPAPRVAVGVEGTTAPGADRDLGDNGLLGEVHGHGNGRTRGQPITELARLTQAPAPCVAVGVDGAGVSLTGDDLRELGGGFHTHRLHGDPAETGPQLTEVGRAPPVCPQGVGRSDGRCGVGDPQSRQEQDQHNPYALHPSHPPTNRPVLSVYAAEPPRVGSLVAPPVHLRCSLAT